MGAPRRPNMSVDEQLVDLYNRVQALETRGRSLPISDDPPAAAAAPEGAHRVATTTPRLWIRVGGVWRYTALT